MWKVLDEFMKILDSFESFGRFLRFWKGFFEEFWGVLRGFGGFYGVLGGFKRFWGVLWGF